MVQLSFLISVIPTQHPALGTQGCALFREMLNPQTQDSVVSSAHQGGGLVRLCAEEREVWELRALVLICIRQLWLTSCAFLASAF